MKIKDYTVAAVKSTDKVAVSDGDTGETKNVLASSIIGLSSTADGVSYDNTDSGLTATDIQAALDEVVASPTLGYTETIVNLTQGQLRTMGAAPKEILPAPGANTYYEYSGVIEYTRNTIDFDWGGGAIMIGDEQNYSGTWIRVDNLSGENFVISFSSSQPVWGVTLDAAVRALTQPTPLNQPIIITTSNGVDPTLGNGSFRIKIYHRTITFGA
jgi:hypothetical protein